MTNNNEVFFDEKSGISIEEQKEIMSHINGIAEKHRLQLSQGASGGKNNIKAKKTGAFFPLAVNVAAAVVLLGGALFLFSFNRRADAQVKTGGAVYNLTEMALIEDLRRETAELIAAKEMEMALITSRLEEVDAQLAQLFSGGDLTAEQLDAQERLFAMQSSYRDGLSVLQDERSQILEASRSREARVRAQLDERTRVHAASSGELDSSMAELERLSGEQERIAAIDAQLAGGLSSVYELVNSGHYDQASQTIANLRDFANNNSLASARSYQSRREIYNQALNSLEMIVEEMRRFQDINSEGWDLYERNIQMEETITEMQKTIDAFNAGSSGQARRLSELEESITSLRTSVSTLETSASDKDRTITSLETERSTLTQTLTDLRTVNSEQEQEITNLRNQIAIIRQALQE
jgi:chromosome segregation ATPase